MFAARGLYTNQQYLVHNCLGEKPVKSGLLHFALVYQPAPKWYLAINIDKNAFFHLPWLLKLFKSIQSVNF